MVAAREDRLWVKVMIGRYLKGKSFFGYVAKRGDSRVWRGILSTRDIIRRGSCFQVGDGRSIDFQYDPWVPRIGTKSLSIQEDRVIVGIEKVVDLLDGEN